MQEKRAFHERKACRMEINITEEPMAALEDYGHVPIAFEVNRVLDVVVRHDGLDGFVLSERRDQTTASTAKDGQRGPTNIRFVNPSVKIVTRTAANLTSSTLGAKTGPSVQGSL